MNKRKRKFKNMEYWELVKDDINFEQLYKDTCCTTELIVRLKCRRLLTTEEEEKLLAIGKNDGNFIQSYHLYKILQTRKGSYETLLEVLHDLCQTGAWEILKNAVAKYKEAQRVLERQSRVDLLLNARMQLRGTCSTIQEAIPGFSQTDALKVLDDPELNNEFSAICKKGHPFINLDSEIPKPRKLYIPRRICNRLVLQENAFRINGIDDVFVVKGMNRIELDKLVQPNWTVSSSKYRRTSTCRHIYLEADEHWDDLTIVCKSPMHLVNYENDQLILYQSTAVTEVILKYSSNKSRQNDAYSSEDAFVEQLMSTGHKSKGALICDVPGMGKTLLMESLANKLAKMQTNCIVFFVQLSTLSETLTPAAEVPIGYNALVFALKQVCASKMIAWILQQYLQVSGSLIYFFMDGFDEIRENLIVETTSFLVELNKTGTVQLVISSRPHLRLHLEKTFNLLSYDILPFCRQDQIHAIVSRWMDASPLASHKNLEVFAENCIKSLNKIQGVKENEILGIPLKCHLLAGVYEKKIKQTSENQHNLSVIQELEIKSIRVLYDLFVEEGISKGCNTQLTLVMKEKIIHLHTFEALKLLFPNIAKTYAEIKGFCVDSLMPEEILRAGIMSAVNSSKMHFLHRTLAEYFAGRFFAEYWMHNVECDPLLRATIGIYYLEEVIRKVGCKDPEYNDMAWKLMPMPIYEQYYFSFFTVLWFQEDISSDTQYGQDFLPHIVEHTSIPSHVLLHYQDLLSCYTNLIMKACIDAGFASILRIIVKMYQCLLPNKPLEEIFKDNHHSNVQLNTVYILCYIAYKGKPAIGNMLVDMFGPPNQNYLLSFCQNFPDNFMSPVDDAIDVNDIDAFLYFVKILPLSWERILLRLLLSTRTRKEAVEIRLSMFRAITSVEHNQELSKVTEQDIKVYLESLFDRNYLERKYEWVRFTYKFDVSLKGLHLQNKVTILKEGIEILDDTMIVQLLTVLFGKYNKASNLTNSLTKCKGVGLGGTDYVLSETVLHDLDLEDAERTLKLVPFDYMESLKNVQNLETLKIFARMCSNTTNHRHHKCKYLFVAVYKGNIEWVNYLIETGHYSGSQNINEKSPLHALSDKNSVEITRLLVENGANIYVLNNRKENIAHTILKFNCSKSDTAKEEISKWVTYTLEEEYTQLWNMEDIFGKTPFVALIDSLGVNHPTTKAVLSHCKYLKFLSAGSKRALLKHSFINDKDKEIIGLLLKLFATQENECVEKDEYETVNICDCIDLKAKTVLDSLDIDNAKEVTANKDCYFDNSFFRNVDSTETLKILMAIYPETSFRRQMSFLHLSVNQGKAAWVSYLIEEGFDLNMRDKDGNTPLLLLPKSDSLEIARLIFKSGADAFAVNNYRQNIAHRIAEGINHNDLMNWVTFIIQNGPPALWNMKDDSRQTPLELLIQTVGLNHPAVQTVKSHNTSLKLLPDKNKRLLLQEYIKEKTDEEILELLKELFGIRPQLYKRQSDVEVTTADAWKHSNDEVFKIDSKEFLSELDLDEAKQAFEDLSIGVPNRIESIETIKVLVTLHKTSNCFNGKQQGYLYRAVAIGRAEMMEYLIQSGYDVNMQDADGQSPLHHVTTNRPLEVFRVLVKNGANVYAADRSLDNVAHMLVKTFQNGKRIYILHEWAAYTLENGFLQLWVRKNWIGETPYQLLSEIVGPDHPTTKFVSSKLQTLESPNFNLTT